MWTIQPHRPAQPTVVHRERRNTERRCNLICSHLILLFLRPNLQLRTWPSIAKCSRLANHSSRCSSPVPPTNTNVESKCVFANEWVLSRWLCPSSYTVNESDRLIQTADHRSAKLSRWAKFSALPILFLFCFFENAYSFNWAHIVCCGDHAGQPHWKLDNYTEQFCLPYAPTNEVRPSLTLLRAAQLPSNKAPCLCMLMIPLLIISFRNLPTFHPPSDSWLLSKRRYFTCKYEYFKQNILAPFKNKSAQPTRKVALAAKDKNSLKRRFKLKSSRLECVRDGQRKRAIPNVLIIVRWKVKAFHSEIQKG